MEKLLQAKLKNERYRLEVWPYAFGQYRLQLYDTVDGGVEDPPVREC